MIDNIWCQLDNSEDLGAFEEDDDHGDGGENIST